MKDFHGAVNAEMQAIKKLKLTDYGNEGGEVGWTTALFLGGSSPPMAYGFRSSVPSLLSV